MPLTIATWNINSVRLRAPLVEDFLQNSGADILCLQETKSPVEKIPAGVFEALGFKLISARGFKGYNGVAILSRVPVDPVDHMLWCERDDGRHCAARLANGTVLHNFYVPAGGDEPDREKNEKFGHKLDFVAEMTRWSEGLKDSHILVGDLNIAPFENDVWSHKQLLKVVSHTPVEVDAMNGLRTAGDWTDTTRVDIPEPTRIYSWWSYRAKDWQASNKGRRLDHIWERGSNLHVAGTSRVLTDYRGKEKPSDHAPVLAGFDI